VTAYQGAAPFITSKTHLSAAARILAIEACHIGTIRTLLFAQQNVYYTKAAALISALRASLSGAQDDQGIGADQSTIDGGFPSPSNITNTDPNSINFARTPRQVLNIVYGASGARKGGFFPDGANGGPKFGELLSETGAGRWRHPPGAAALAWRWPAPTGTIGLSDPRSSQHVRLLDATCGPPWP